MSVQYYQSLSTLLTCGLICVLSLIPRSGLILHTVFYLLQILVYFFVVYPCVKCYNFYFRCMLQTRVSPILEKKSIMLDYSLTYLWDALFFIGTMTIFHFFDQWGFVASTFAFLLYWRVKKMFQYFVATSHKFIKFIGKYCKMMSCF
jgi:hypothetical protein